jgi:uncharacterized protein YggE
MRKTFFIAIVLLGTLVQAQETKPIPQISVAGEGKVSVVPDQVFISVTVETKGAVSNEVKKLNDNSIEKVIQFINKFKLPKEDVQTKQVVLNPQYNYEQKKQQYYASQTIDIELKNIKQYDDLMEGLVSAGINKINRVEFKTSKLELHQSEARKLAMKAAKIKAEDYVSVLGQKIGKALIISDNSQGYYPQPMYEARMTKTAMMSDENSMPKETLAIGEITITANVNVSFILE